MADRPISRRDLFTFWRKKPAPPVVPRAHVRPPGAVSEEQLLDQCIRCGQCVEVCPAEAIVIDAQPGKGFGTPLVLPRVQACVLCNGLQCTQTCPSGALQPLRFHHEVKMGTAILDESTCLNTRGEPCDVCVRECPVPYAIALTDGKVVVDPAVCVGCGGCEQHCPTEPKSIRVAPR